MTTALRKFRCKDSRTRASYRAVNDGNGGVSVEDDLALVRRLAAREPRAFEQLLEVYQARVERLAHRLLGWRAGSDVEDAVQDVFLAALTHAKRVRAERGLWPWLAAITVNACRTRRRRAWVRETFIRRQHAAPAPGNDSREASAAAEDAEALRRVRDAIDRLPARDREVIVLHCLEEMRLTYVAGVLGVSVNAIHVRLHRARQRLQTELGTRTNEF
jgi:RNA polymerase sigma-70 factor (ECF subfamily)